ncbi:ankyrin repeat [Hyphodiscus hymeniophilus]|uniref:Ankyrin repeat n=1 Tax=Hyphodiscus hymeniophilus TaxID=353542 RepID=A0A9P6SM74_9HELO|nr:ankyrin repeat [Hyphodiscus hymeniophilus]
MLSKFLDKNPQIALAFFYFRFDDQNKPDLNAMLRSLIKQLYCCRPNTLDLVETLHQYRQREQHPELSILLDALYATIRGFSSVYVVIDALDEYPEDRMTLLEAIRCIQMSELSNLHMLCTSRRELDIEIASNSFFKTAAKFDMDLTAHARRHVVDHDIGLYIDRMLNTYQYSGWPENMKLEARDVLVKKADGMVNKMSNVPEINRERADNLLKGSRVFAHMFQYVASQFAMLSEHSTPSAIRQALQELPIGLDATHERILCIVPTRYQDEVTRMLKWLAYSIRPLILDELADIFVLDYKGTTDKPPTLPLFDPDSRLNTPDDVLKYLPGIVTKYNRYRRGPPVIEIRLAHFSIKEYLISRRITESRAAKFSTTAIESHLHISEACIAYHLSMSQVHLAPKDDIRSYGIWDYVVYNWYIHLEKVPRAKWPRYVLERVSQLLTPRSRSLINLMYMTDPLKRIEWARRKYTRPTELGSPLYYVASCGALELSVWLLGGGSDIDDQGEYEVALGAAASHNSEVAIQSLINRGANINAQGGFYGNALQAASTTGLTAIVELLLDRGADVNAQGGVYGTTLQAASFGKSTAIVELLLDRGANVNAQGGPYGNALQAASSSGNEAAATEVQMSTHKEAPMGTHYKQRHHMGMRQQLNSC